jgi:hypothetical protein
VGVEWRPEEHGVAGAAVPAGVAAATVSEAGLVPDEDLVRPERVPLGHRVGGWVIHFPPVV